jgi:hypothetical protein
MHGLMSHSSLNHARRSITVIWMEPWHRRSWENFQNGELFTLSTSQLNTAGDLNA